MKNNREVEEIIGEQEYPLRQAALVDDRLFLEYLIDAVSEIRTFDLTRKNTKVFLKREYYTYTILDYDKQKLFLKRETFWEPYSIYLVKDSKLILLDRNSWDGSYIVEEDFATSNDGTRIHYFLIKNKNAKKRHNLWI